jgi:Uma2 family endonuclease
VHQTDWDAMPPNDYPVYAPVLVVEVLSPSNTPAKVTRQRIVAMSAGKQEFWVVDPEKRTVQVGDLCGMKEYCAGNEILLDLFGGAVLAVDRIFEPRGQTVPQV